MKKSIGLLLIFSALPFYIFSQQFEVVHPKNFPTKRSECAAAVVGDAMFLIGGRGARPINRFNFTTQTWDSVGMAPIELHHFQAVEYKNEIYVAGALSGPFPHESPVAEVYAYSPTTNTWRVETTIPENRRRGATGCLILNDKLFLVCGIVDGHFDGNVAWLDEYDFKTKKWKQLPDAPRARDHFQAVVVNNKLYAAGGRRTNAKTDQVFTITVPEVDVFDLKKKKWVTLSSENNIPTPRAGCSALSMENSFVVIGGESGKQDTGHNEAEVFDTKKNKWVKIFRLQQGRHGMQAVRYKNKIYISAGAGNRGGGPELDETEVCTVDH
jgi:Galactose oxidase, central domain/Kelch motif